MPDDERMTLESHASLLAQAQAALARDDAARALAIALDLDRTSPESAAVLALLANAAIALDRAAIGIDALTRLRRWLPRDAAVARSLAALHNRHGSRLRRDSDEAAAAQHFAEALVLDPEHALAGFNLALSLQAMQQPREAAAALDAHVRRHPGDAEAALLACQWRLASAPSEAADELDALLASPLAAALDPAAVARVAARAGRVSAALAALRRVAPHACTRVAIGVGDLLREQGEIDAAHAAVAAGYAASDRGARSPGLRARLASLSIAPLMASRETIRADRSRIAAELETLHAEWTPAFLARCEPRLEQLAWSNFHLAYHGENDRELQRGFASLLQRAALAFAPGLAEAPRTAISRRVGLLSSSWRHCTVGSWFGGWIDWLRQAGYDVHLYQLGPQRDATTDRLAARASAFHFHSGDLRSLADAIRAEALDLLIYPELGMDARLMPLAALRLARRQAVAWGHPVTSGFSSIDGYFTCADMEPADAGAHYVESLLPLPGLGIDYPRPDLPGTADPGSLGLPTPGPRVLLPHSLFKLHPDDDALVAELAMRVPHARLVLFEGEHPRWRERLLARLAPAFTARGLDPSEHLHWLALGSRSRFLQINRACDLMLDCRRWSGGNTSLDALVAGLPILTCPGSTMRARQSAAMLGRLGLADDLVGDDPAALVDTAAALLADAPARAAVSHRIRANLDGLFAPDAARAAFLAHVDRLCSAGPDERIGSSAILQ
jgi:hypothetical protein